MLGVLSLSCVCACVCVCVCVCVRVLVYARARLRVHATLAPRAQTFLSFQWDILLLEVGFLSSFAVPLLSRDFGPCGGAPAAMWALRFTFFKLMLMAGVVKLLADCRTWCAVAGVQLQLSRLRFWGSCVLCWFFGPRVVFAPARLHRAHRCADAHIVLGCGRAASIVLAHAGGL